MQRHYDREDHSTQKLRPEDRKLITDFLEGVRDRLKADYPDLESRIFEPLWAGVMNCDSIPILLQLSSPRLMEKMGSLYPFYKAADGTTYADFSEVQIAINSIFIKVTPESEKVYLGKELIIHHRFDTGQRHIRTPLEDLTRFIGAFNEGYENYSGFKGEITERKWREKNPASQKLLMERMRVAENFEDPSAGFAATIGSMRAYCDANPSYVFGHMVSKSYTVDSLSQSSIESDIGAFLRLGYESFTAKK